MAFFCLVSMLVVSVIPVCCVAMCVCSLCVLFLRILRVQGEEQQASSNASVVSFRSIAKDVIESYIPGVGAHSRVGVRTSREICCGTKI